MANLFWFIFVLSISVVAGREVPSHCEAFTVYKCLPYVTDDEYLHPPGPGAGCCGDVSAILENSSDCFCYALNEVLLYGMALNKTKGLGLPEACGLSGPKVGGCFDGGYIPDTPVAVPPTPAEAPPAPETPETPTPVPAISPPSGNSPSEAPLSPPAPYQAPSSPPSSWPAPSIAAPVSASRPVPAPTPSLAPENPSSQPTPSPVTGSPLIPSPVRETPVPSPVRETPAPSPVRETPAPSPVRETPAPSFISGSPAPAPAPASGAQELKGSLVVLLVTMVTMAIAASSISGF